MMFTDLFDKYNSYSPGHLIIEKQQEVMMVQTIIFWRFLWSDCEFFEFWDHYWTFFQTGNLFSM